MEEQVASALRTVLATAEASGADRVAEISAAGQRALAACGGPAALAAALWSSSSLAAWLAQHPLPPCPCPPQPLADLLACIAAHECPSVAVALAARDAVGLFDPASALAEAALQAARGRAAREEQWGRLLASAAAALPPGSPPARALCAVLAAAQDSVATSLAQGPLRPLVQQRYGDLLALREPRALSGSDALALAADLLARASAASDAAAAAAAAAALPVDALAAAARWALAHALCVELGDVRGASETPVGRARYELRGLALRSVRVDEGDVALAWDPASRTATLSARNVAAELPSFAWRYDVGGGVVGDSGRATAAVARGEASLRVEMSVDGARRPALALRGVRVALGAVQLRVEGSEGAAPQLYAWLVAQFASAIEEHARASASAAAAEAAEQLVAAVNSVASEHLPPVDVPEAEALRAQAAADLRNFFASDDFL
eukprot:m51a1_g14147 hypothetical protein (438) ;mRNA; f:14533-15950